MKKNIVSLSTLALTLAFFANASSLTVNGRSPLARPARTRAVSHETPIQLCPPPQQVCAFESSSPNR